MKFVFKTTLAVALLALLTPFLLSGKVVLGQDSRPNIVFFLADDMGLGDTSAYQDLTGNANQYQLDTPNLEALAARGTRFTDAHSGAAVCSPTRVGLLTGSHSFRSLLKSGVATGNDIDGSVLGGDRRTFATMLQNRGYGTYGVGKWHIGMQVDHAAHEVYEGPVQAGFDRFTGTPNNFPGNGPQGNAPDGHGMVVDNKLMTFKSNGSGDPIYTELVEFGSADAVAWDPYDVGNTGGNRKITESIQETNLTAAGDYLTDHVTSADTKDKPFLLYYASHANHTPFVGPDTLAGVTVDGSTKDGGYLDVPTVGTGQDTLPDPNDPNYGDVGIDNHWDPYLETDANGNVTQHGPGERFKRVEENDIALGKLVEHLENTPDPRNPGKMLIDTTMIVFTSDNGSDIKSEPSVGALPQSSDGVITDIAGKKATVDEGGTRVPFIVAWAGEVAQGGTSSALVGLNDIYATLADVAGHELAADEAVDSSNVIDAIKGGATDDTLIYKTKHRLILRKGDMKLIASDNGLNGSANDSKYDGNLDFENLEAFRLYDLSSDLGETNRLDNDPAYATVMGEMLAELQGYVTSGYQRSGAVAAVDNGQNFVGSTGGQTSILDANNYSWSGATNNDPSQFEPGVLSIDNPSFVYRDGVAPGRVDAAWIVQGGGDVTFTGSSAGIINGSTYELRDGSLTATTAFQVGNQSTLTITGGIANLGGQTLRINGDGALVEMVRGDINADQLRFAADDTAFRFLDGVGGTLRLEGNNPFSFASGIEDAFIDFEVGTGGEIVSKSLLADYESMWDEGLLRVGGLASNQYDEGFFESFFSFTGADSNGFTTFTTRSLVVAVPEPSSVVLLGLTSLVIAGRRRRRNC